MLLAKGAATLKVDHHRRSARLDDDDCRDLRAVDDGVGVGVDGLDVVCGVGCCSDPDPDPDVDIGFGS